MPCLGSLAETAGLSLEEVSLLFGDEDDQSESDSDVDGEGQDEDEDEPLTGTATPTGTHTPTGNGVHGSGSTLPPGGLGWFTRKKAEAAKKGVKYTALEAGDGP